MMRKEEKKSGERATPDGVGGKKKRTVRNRNRRKEEWPENGVDEDKRN